MSEPIRVEIDGQVFARAAVENRKGRGKPPFRKRLRMAWRILRGPR